MGRRHGGNLIYRKIFGLLGVGALLVVVYGAHSNRAAAGWVLAASAAQSAEKMALPAPGAYKVDANHSFAYFGARHHVVGLVRGRFDKIAGTIHAAREPGECSVDITIDVASISTQNTKRDEDLQGPDYFDLKKFPAMIYRGHGVRRGPGDTWIMDGSLTMHGVTKMVPLSFTFNGLFPNMPADQPARVAFHGTTGVKRAEFGMGARDNLDELGSSSAPDVEIEIDVEADASAPAK
jgi:polyisoprenoid-binding protein YceI